MFFKIPYVSHLSIIKRMPKIFYLLCIKQKQKNVKANSLKNSQICQCQPNIPVVPIGEVLFKADNLINYNNILNYYKFQNFLNEITREMGEFFQGGIQLYQVMTSRSCYIRYLNFIIYHGHSLLCNDGHKSIPINFKFVFVL